MTDIFALDIETAPDGDNIPDKQAYALEPFNCGKRSKITSVSITRGVVVDTLTSCEDMRDYLGYLQGKIVFGANVLFDVSYLCKAFGYDAVKGIRWMDVQTLAKFIENGDEHRNEEYNLAKLAQRYATDWPHLEDYVRMKAEEHKPGFDAQYWLDRGHLDAEVTHIVATKLMSLLPKQQIKAFQCMSRCIAPLARGYNMGFDVDHSVIDELADDVEPRMAGYLSDLGLDPKVIASPKQFSNLLFNEWGLTPIKHSDKTGLASTDADVLKELHFRNQDPRLEKLMEYIKLKTLQSKYIKGLRSARDYLGEDRVYANPRIFAAATSRMSYSSSLLKKHKISIAMHQIPRRSKEGKYIKKALKAPEGYGMIVFDFSAQELRVAAVVSGDPVMTNAFAKGLDLHSNLCAEIFGYSYEDVVEANKAGFPAHINEHRSAAKLLNLSCLYRTGADTLALKFFTTYNTRVTKSRSTEYLNGYKRTYKGIPNYWRSEILASRNRGYAETLGGGVRYYTRATDWSGESSAINHKIQGSAALQTYYALYKVTSRYEHVICALQVHDSLIFFCPVDNLRETAYDMHNYLNTEINYSNIWDVEVIIPFTVETSFGYNYAELEPVR